MASSSGTKRRRRKKKMKVRLQEEEDKSSIDYISELPDDILNEILYYLPCDDILRTSCLSKRWRHLYELLPQLDFDVRHMQSLSERTKEVRELRDECYYNHKIGSKKRTWRKRMPDDEIHYEMASKRRRLANSVSRVLRKHKGPIEQFCLSFNPVRVKRHRACVFKWISMLQSRRVLGLDLDFSENCDLDVKASPEYQLPCSNLLFRFRSLTKLVLTYCCLKIPTKKGREFVGLRSLQVLELNHVFINDKDMMKHILANASLLKRLVLCNCHQLTRLHVPPELLKLKDLLVFDSYGIEEIKVDAPYLEDLRYRGQMIRFSISELTPVTNVSLQLQSSAYKIIPDGRFDGRPRHDLRSILLPLKFPQVKHLKANIVVALKLMKPNIERIPEKLHSMSYANLERFQWFIDSDQELGFCYLLRILEISPRLKNLIIYFIQPRWQIHESNKEIWVPPPAEYSIRLGPIKRIHIGGFTADKNQMELFEFLLKKYILLELMTVVPYKEET